ncbi:hypothetical protein [Aestuariivivens insulae]|uniref:hypothetical protein n=1 Tax=Aestuariivivens insulae TaxID=1621988 RepID=UPI001F598347|nr:hypothetical protein [Aestuariivivens insulae]
MKKLTYILFASVIILTGCSEDFELNDNDQNLNVQLLAGKYVAFTADGANVTIPDIDAEEGETGIELNVEVPTGSTSNVIVNFTFGGSAVFGTDFTVANATSSGGSVTIVPDPGDDPADLIDNVDIVVDLLTDNNQDGDKVLEVILSSASNADGSVLVGRGGTDLLKTAVINISDID